MSPKRTARWVWALPLLLVACQLGYPGGGDPFGRSGVGLVVLEVRNPLEQEVTLRLRSPMGSKDLGVIPARTVMQVSFEWGEPGRGTFQVEPAMGSRFSLPALEMRQGDRFELVIGNPIERSSVRR